MSGGPHREVVKVRLRSQVYTSRAMSQGDARAARDDLRARVLEARDGVGFVEFTDRHGREVSLRAREVAVIEVGTAIDDDDLSGRSRTSAGAPRQAGIPSPPPLGGSLGVVQGGALRVPAHTGTGTDYLRNQASR